MKLSDPLTSLELLNYFSNQPPSSLIASAVINSPISAIHMNRELMTSFFFLVQP